MIIDQQLLTILIPLYCLITLGYLLRRYRFASDDFWNGLEKFIYYILFPALLFVALYKAPLTTTLLYQVVLVLMSLSLIAGALQWLGLLSGSVSKPALTSMFQGAVRANTIVGLVIAAWIVPESGIAIMSIVILLMVLFNNLSSVMVLQKYCHSTSRPSWFRGIILNPLILSCIAGLAANISTINIPLPLIDTTDFLGRSALPLALIAVGAGLRIGNIFQKKLPLLLSSISKLIVLPIAVVAVCIWAGIDADTSKIFILYAALPTATSAYILAKQMGGDSELMAQIITFQTLASAITLPVFLAIAQTFGIS